MVKRKGLEEGDSAWASIGARSHRTPLIIMSLCQLLHYFTIQAGVLWLKGNRFCEGIACRGWLAIATRAMHVLPRYLWVRGETIISSGVKEFDLFSDAFVENSEGNIFYF